MERAHDAARRDRELKCLVEQRGDFPDGDAELRMEHRRETDRVGPQLHRRRADRVGGLQWMPALYPTPALDTVPDFDPKLAHQRSHRRQVFLILRDDVDMRYGPVTVRTGPSHRGVVAFVDVRGHGPMHMPTIGRPRFAAWAPGRERRRALGKRRGLAIASAAGGLEVLAQPLILAPESVPFAFQLRNTIAEIVVLAAEGLGCRGRILRCVRVGRHTDLMSHLDAPYKSRWMLTSAQTR